ncbi:hypothetical protein [Endozoicomonas sp. ONNA1]|uniref:hypothetical protein n=1 Tax=Endozoicomonas sp. ONNA1 TaxID=2828740 RepID=UPI0021479D60|nr:hypothetical protein [Endozoicomonas sp. ONNA1]
MIKLFTALLFLPVFFQTVKAQECSHPENSACLCKLIKKANDIVNIQCKLIAILPAINGEPQSQPPIQALNLQQATLQNELSHEFNQLTSNPQQPPADQVVGLRLFLLLQIQLQIVIINNWYKQN